MARRVGTLALIGWLLLWTFGAQAARIYCDCQPPEETLVDKPLTLEFTLRPSGTSIDYALVYYRNLLRSSWKTVFIKKRSGERWTATIPGRHVSNPGIELYAVAFDQRGKKRMIFRDEESPAMVRVVTSFTPPPAPPLAMEVDPEQGSDSLTPGGPEESVRLPEPRTLASESETGLDETPEAETESDSLNLADEFALFTFETEAKVVSASKVEQDISHSPSAITVITGEDIRNYGSSSIADVLRTVPGMDFLEISSADKNLTTRGFNREGANKMLVLIDGRSVYVDLFGITFWEALPVPVEDIDRMEVIRGPGSTLYGANAFSGVVNIYTRKPEDIKGLIYSFDGGTGGFTGSAVFGDVKDNLGYKVSASYRRLLSYDDMDELALESVKGNLFAEYSIAKDFSFSLTGGAEKDKVGSIFSLIGPVSVNTTQAYTKLNGQWKGLKAQFFYTYLAADLSFDVPIPGFVAADPMWYDSRRLGTEQWAEERDREIITLQIDQQDPPRVRSSGHTFDLDLTYSIELAEMDRITAGGNLRFVLLDSPDLVDSSSQRNSYSAFLQNELYPWDWFLFNAGLRYDLMDVDEENPDHPGREVDNIHSISPRGALVFIPHKDHTLRVSGGVSFRNPAFFESNMKVKLADMTVSAPLSKLTPPSILTALDPNATLPDLDTRAPLAFESNPNLKPEKMVSAEFGYNGRIARRVEVSADFFFNWVRDLILFEGDTDKLYWALNPFSAGAIDPEVLDPFNFNNDVDANNVGFEVEARFRITSWLRGFVNYSFQHIWVTNANQLKSDYVDRKEAFVDALPDSINFEAAGVSTPNRIFDDSGEYSKDAYLDALTENVSLEDITTVHKENPSHKANIGFNTHYKGFSANIFGHFVSETTRKNFLTRLSRARFLTFGYDPDRTGNWVRYEGMGPVAVYSKSADGTTTTYGIESIDPYFILNLNASYTLFDGRMEVGVALLDLLHLPSLWQDVGNNGFSLSDQKVHNGSVIYREASGIASPRYSQYPRQLLFGQSMGGETIPTRVSLFIRGRI